jgi:L-asparagine oxygenase
MFLFSFQHIMNVNREPVIDLNPTEIQILFDLAAELHENPTDTPERFCRAASEISHRLPSILKDRLSDFAKHGSSTGFLLLKNLVIENLPPTPDSNLHKIGEQTLLARIQAIVISFFSEMIAYEAEGYGRLFQDVIPTKSMSNNQTSLGSNTELEIHTEQAFSTLRPDFLSLACLRGDVQAKTYILPVQKIIENISEEEKQLLREPLWNTGVDLSFKLNGNEFIEGDIRGPLHILYGSYSDPYLIFDQDLMTGTCLKSISMIQKIIDIYYGHRISHNLRSGEIIIVDNRRAVHGRSPFFPKFDGADRFLVRCFSVLDYEKSAYARIERTVGAIYS